MTKRKFYIGFIDIIEDELPKEDNKKADALKLQNELGKYIYREDNKVKCRVVKYKR